MKIDSTEREYYPKSCMEIYADRFGNSGMPSRAFTYFLCV